MSLPPVNGPLPRAIITTLGTNHGAILARLRTEGDTLQIFLSFVDGRSFDTQFLWTTFTPNGEDIDVEHQAVRVPASQHEPFVLPGNPVRYTPEDEDPPAPPYAPSPHDTAAAQAEEQRDLAAEPEEIEIITSTSVAAAATPAEPPAVEEPGHRLATTVEDDNSSKQYWQAVDEID